MKVETNKVAKTHLICSFLILISCLQSLIISCEARRIKRHLSSTPGLKMKAVNLGGWLVTEGWIHPSLFDGIPNNNLTVRFYPSFYALLYSLFLVYFICLFEIIPCIVKEIN